MISNDLTKRIITSIPLLLLLIFSIYYSYILILSLILISLISWIEFKGLISKIFKTNNVKFNLYKLSINILSISYILIFSLLIYIFAVQENSKILIFYLFMICICSDIGGLLFGKVFKGKKLTKISPKKTISGSIGSFTLSLILVLVFNNFINKDFFNLFDLVLIAILVSLCCQLGDLFISFLKRKAKVKDTGNILPGHGGLLDRIDGMLFAVPVGIIILKYLI